MPGLPPRDSIRILQLPLRLVCLYSGGAGVLLNLMLSLDVPVAISADLLPEAMPALSECVSRNPNWGFIPSRLFQLSASLLLQSV